MMKIGFIGLGLMGLPMAKNLIKAGYQVLGFDVVPQNNAKFEEAGGKPCKDIVTLAREADLVITMLPTNEIVKNTVAGEAGLIHHMAPGGIIVDMSSSAPEMIAQLGKQAAEKGLYFADGPVSGGPIKAEDGTLAIMVGCEEEVFDRIKDVLGAMGATITHMGPVGSGNITKLANQIIVAVNLAGMGEAFAFAAKAGINPETLFQAIRGGLAGSTVMEQRAPKIINRDFEPGARMAVHIKDLLNALEVGHQISAVLPLTAQILEFMMALRADGKENIDHCGLVQYYEKAANVIVKK